jgi:hypothetical protein
MRKGKQIWGNGNWQVIGERKEASALLILGLPEALFGSIEQRPQQFLFLCL